MLQAFTWQQFLVAAMIFSLVWLLIAGLVFFRKQLFGLLSGDKQVEPLKHAWADDFEADDLMGKAQEPEGVQVLSQHEFGFTPPLGDEKVTVDADAQQNDLFDLMENIKRLLDAGLSKRELIEAVSMEVHRFPRLAASPLLDNFYEMVCEKADFELSVADLQEPV